LGIIKRRLSRRGAVEVDARSNTLIVTDVRENIDAVRQLVSLLDQPEPQVEIEARIVIATRTFSRDLGIALSAIVLGPRGSGASGATLPGSSTGSGGGSGGNTTGLVPGGIPNGIGLQPNNSLLSSIPNTVIGLTTGIFGTAQISALITAGENKGQGENDCYAARYYFEQSSCPNRKRFANSDYYRSAGKRNRRSSRRYDRIRQRSASPRRNAADNGCRNGYLKRRRRKQHGAIGRSHQHSENADAGDGAGRRNNCRRRSAARFGT
jgi:hypothetical protein